MFAWVSIEKNESSLCPLITPAVWRWALTSEWPERLAWTGRWWQRRPFHLERASSLYSEPLTAVTSSISARRAQTRLRTSPKSKQQSSNPPLRQAAAGEEEEEEHGAGEDCPSFMCMCVHIWDTEEVFQPPDWPYMCLWLVNIGPICVCFLQIDASKKHSRQDIWQRKADGLTNTPTPQGNFQKYWTWVFFFFGGYLSLTPVLCEWVHGWAWNVDQQEKAAGQKCKSKAQTCQTILKMPVKMSGEEKEEKKIPYYCYSYNLLWPLCKYKVFKNIQLQK